MKKIILNNLNKLEKQEQKILNKREVSAVQEKINPIMDKIEAKVPESLKKTLDSAFYAAFKMVFEKGTKYIEKMYDKEKLQSDHNINDFRIRNNINNRTIKSIDKLSKKSSLINASISTLEGAGLGLIGLGLPDIPLFTSIILKTIYEISLSYGFVYELDDEKIFVLKLIQGALSKGEAQRLINEKVEDISNKLESHIPLNIDLNEEIKKTSDVLSDSMLTSKFIQGIPVVGAVACFTNFSVINKISKYSTIKYKKRYLNNKLR